MILIINLCNESLHYPEFVKPIEKILLENKFFFKIIHYFKLKNSDLSKADKIIIAGTSLQDNDFLKHLDKFNWMQNYEKPILGICAGMQIIGLIFGGKIKKETEIGFCKENFTKEFLSLIGEQEVYHLHNNYIVLPKDFESFTKSKIPQAVKHKDKEIYGVLFHPEARNKDIIRKFCSL